MRIILFTKIMLLALAWSGFAQAQQIPESREMCMLLDIMKKEARNKFAPFKGREIVDDMFSCRTPSGATRCVLHVWDDASHEKKYSIQFSWTSHSVERAGRIAEDLALLAKGCDEGKFVDDSDPTFDPDENEWSIEAYGFGETGNQEDSLTFSFYARDSRKGPVARMKATYTYERY